MKNSAISTQIQGPYISKIIINKDVSVIVPDISLVIFSASYSLA